MPHLLSKARERAGAAWRAHKDRSARNHRKLPHGAAPMLWVNFLVFVAATALLGSTWMLLVFIAGSVGHVDWAFDWRNGSDGVRRANWSAEANVHALIGVGLFLASAAVAAFNAVWLHVRTHLTGIFRSVVTGIGALVALFMISGAIVVQQWGTDDRTRDEVAATQTAQAGVAAIDSQISGIETEMGRLCAPNLTTYQAQACRAGAASWGERARIASQQTDANSRAQLPYIQRAQADAEQGDRWRAQLVQLRAQRAAAAVTTVQASVQQVRADGWFAVFSHTLEDLRKPFIAVLGELLAMTMFGVALAALRSRQQSVETSGWADEAHRIEDKTEEEPIASQPYTRQTVMREENLETGEVKVQITPKPHWRTVKKGKPQKVQIAPEVMEDETGVAQDGGNRIGTPHGEHEPLVATESVVHGLPESLPGHADAEPETPKQDNEVQNADESQNDVLLNAGEASQNDLSQEEDDEAWAVDESAPPVEPVDQPNDAESADAGDNNQLSENEQKAQAEPPSVTDASGEAAQEQEPDETGRDVEHAITDERRLIAAE